MSSSTDILCGPCAYANQHTNATKWCTNCEEGICRDCEKFHVSTKITSDHKLISVKDCKKIADVSIIQVCENHGRILELFCKSHDQLLCVLCIPQQHATCTDVIALDEAVKTLKRSSALTNLEETLEKTLKDLTHCISNRESASKDIEDQENTIKNRIRDTRRIINAHLDELEQKILLELAEKSEICKSKNTRNLSFFKKSINIFNQIREETSQIKEYTSDLQVFLGSHQMTKSVNEHVESVRTELCSARNYQIEVEMHAALNTLLDSVKNFGEITIVDRDASLPFSTNTEQAQIPIERITTVNDIQLQLKSKFNVRKSSLDLMCITGCTILPNKHVLIADCSRKKQLIEYNDNGEHIRDIPVSSQPFDLTVIDVNLIAVSYGFDKYVEIINMKNDVINKKVKFINRCYGISYQDGKLYTVVYKKGIVVKDVTGKTFNTIKCDVSNVVHLTTSKDRLLYTDYNKNTINCCSLNGEVIWVFKDESVVVPSGVASDNRQNVFVVGVRSNNLTVIQHDGTASKTLLTKSDGLDQPGVVYYDKDSKVLCVVDSDSGNASLYNVT